MGSSQSLATHSCAFQLAIAQLKRQGVTGGAADGGFFGRGLDTGAEAAEASKELREYEGSLSAKAKEQTIRRLAQALKRARVDVDPEGDLDAIVRQLVAQIPNPRGNGKTFPKDAERQEAVCRLVAGVLNDEFSPGATQAADKFVDTSLGAVEVCRQVGEWAHSFAAGVNTEFLAVHASVKNALRNTEILWQVLDESYKRIAQRVSAEGGAGGRRGGRVAYSGDLARDIAPLDEVHRRAMAALKEQLELLKNILNVTLAPAAKELELAMRDHAQGNALVRRLGLKPGTANFADTLAEAVSGLGTAAAVAARVHTALKRVGLSVRAYLDSPSLTALNTALNSRLYGGEVDSAEVTRFLDAARTLREAFGSRADARFGRALAEEGDGAAAGGARGGARGGVDGDPFADEYETKTSTDKRVERQRAERRLIIHEYVKRTAADYDAILAAIKTLAGQLGAKELPVTEKTVALRDAVRRLGNLYDTRKELSLIGLYHDAAARERRETFEATLRMLEGAIDGLLELEMYRGAAPHLARLRAASAALGKTVDFYGDLIKKKYGGAAVAPAATGGAEETLEGFLPSVARAALDLKEAVRTFEYNYYIAGVRRNLDATAHELEAYGEKYESVLGDAVASRLRTLLAEEARALNFTKTTKKADDKAADDAFAGNVVNVAGNAAIRDNAKKAATTLFEARESFVRGVYAAKAKLYKALQAIDLYLKVFTGSLAGDPEAACDFKRILDSLEVIARWFTELTGDKLAEAFEACDGVALAGDARGGPSEMVATDGPHYYTKVAHVTGGPRPGGGLAVAHAQLPGDPGLTIDLAVDTAAAAAADAAKTQADAVKKAQNAVRDVYDNFQALKNLVSAFARIGDRFGGKEVRAQVFMSPTQIFKALTDYLKSSALSMSYLAGPENGAADAAGDGALAAAAPNMLLGGLGGASFRRVGDAVNAIRAAAAQGTPAATYFQWAVFYGNVGDAPGNFAFEDEYFAFAVKAMAAKVLTVLGVFDMFERPGPLFDITPTRMIVGGDAGGAPPIIDDAAGLYFRMPRLVEYYRGIFPGMYENGNLESLRIAMLPEVEGVFTGIIRLVFQRMGGVRDAGDYSDVELGQLVREVNSIYGHFSDQGDVVGAAVAAFIREINRRYGVLKADEVAKYWAFINDMRGRSHEDLEHNLTDYAILPGEDADGDAPPRRAPSDRFMATPEGAAAHRGKHQLYLAASTDARFKLVREFRDRIEKGFASVRNSFGSVSFSELIRQAGVELKRAPSAEDKWVVVRRLIQAGGVASADPARALLFHETVVTGLNVLSGVYTLLRAFQASVRRTDVAEMYDMIVAAAGGGANTLPPAGGAFTAANLADRAHILAGVLGGVAGRDTYLILEAASAADLRAHGRFPANSTARAADLYASRTECVGASVAHKQAAGAFARFVIDFPGAMREFLVNLFQLSASLEGLVEVRFSRSDELPLAVDFAKLRSAVEGLMADVRKYLDILRPHLSHETVERYEARGNVGSVYWLEEHLLDEMIRGVPEKTVDDAANANTLERTSRRLNASFRRFVKKFDTGWGALATPPAAGVSPYAEVPSARPWEAFEPYAQVIARLAFYDATRLNSEGLDAVAGLGAGTVLGPLIRKVARPSTPITAESSLLDYFYAFGANGAVGVQGAQGNVGRYPLWGDGPGLLEQRSLMFVFNQLLARYLVVCLDAPTGRVYINLINNFANGAAAAAVMTPFGNSFPDLAAVAAFGQRGDPKPQATLLMSLAFVLQRLIRDINPTTQISEHLVTTLIDVPLYMKETLRGALPSFAKLFGLVTRGCEFLKAVVQKTSISLWRASMVVLASAASGFDATAVTVFNHAGNNVLTSDAPTAGQINPFPAGALAALEPLTGVTSSDDTKQRFASILDGVSANAHALVSCANEVLKELNDEGVFFQTQEGSIETYTAQYGKPPLMPLSLALYFFRNLAPATSDPPIVPLPSGTPLGELQYGTRALLARGGAVDYRQVPGAKAILDAYNGLATSRDQIPAETYLEFVGRLTRLLRFVVDIHGYAAVLSPVLSVAAPSFATTSLLGGVAGGIRTTDVAAGAGGGLATYRNAVFALALAAGPGGARPLQDVLDVVKSSDQDERVSEIVATVSGATAGARSREEERILNIIDMNVVPINVHALMRDVPLVNVYNYVYTFEQMAALMYGLAAPTIRALGSDDTRTARQMFLRLLFDPYLALAAPRREYGSDVYDLGSEGFVHRIFRGDNGLGLGRPKFLSDQVFGKALFGNVYSAQSDYDEAGAAVSIGVTRGHAGDGPRGRAAAAVAAAGQALAGGNSLLRLRADATDATAANRPRLVAMRLLADTAHSGIDVGGVPMDVATAVNAAATRLGALVAFLRGCAASAARAATITALANAATALGLLGTAVPMLAEEIARAILANQNLRGIALLRAAAQAVSNDHGVDPAFRETLRVQLSIVPAANRDDIRVALATPAVSQTVGIRDALVAERNLIDASDVPAVGVLNFGADLTELGLLRATIVWALVQTAAAGGLFVQGVQGAQAAQNAATVLPTLLATLPDAGARPPVMRPYPDENVRARTLTYATPFNPESDDPESAIHVVTLGAVAPNVASNAAQAGYRAALEAIGLDRFNTRLVRNLFFVTNVLRLVRQKLNRELTVNRRVVASEHDAVNAGVTEYGADPFGPNEVYDTRLPHEQPAGDAHGPGVARDAYLRQYQRYADELPKPRAV